MQFCIRLSGPIFGVKLDLHIQKTVKDFKTSFLIDIAAANVCTMKKNRGLYHVPESRYFNFSPGRVSEIQGGAVNRGLKRFFFNVQALMSY